MFGSVFGTWQVIRDGFVGLVFRDGVFERQVGPGRHRISPRQTLTAVPVISQLLTVPGQEVLTADGFQLRLTAVLTMRVQDARLAVTGHASGYAEACRLWAQLALRNIAASRSAEALATAPRPELEADLAGFIGPEAAKVGVALESASLRDVLLPAEFRRMLTAVERARREGLAALERARAEQASLRSLANAARLLRNNPELQNLRLLQTLGTAATPTVVLGAGALLAPLRGDDPGKSEGGQ